MSLNRFRMNKAVSVILGSKLIYLTLLKQVLDQKKIHDFFFFAGPKNTRVERIDNETSR